jgi:hypothetical protein
LPLTTGAFIDDDTYVAGGFDRAPFLFKKGDRGFKLLKCLDSGSENIKDFSVEEGDLTQSTRFFKNLESKSDAFIPEAAISKERNTKHENFINYLVPLTSGKFATSDPNGNVYFWDA